MKKYEAYKNSGIEWIGQIPEGWSVVPLKYNLSLKGRIGWNGLKSEEFQEKSYAYLVTGQDFNSDVVNWKKCYQINKERYDEDPFIQLENGDLLVTKDGTIGKVAKVVNLDKPACLNSGIFVVKQTKGVFEQNYLYWVLVSNQLKEFVGFNSTGSTIAHLYQNVFENMPLTVPPITEQKAIASYLDYKVDQIDVSISAINTQIEDLKSYRQSIISEAVTKGLNPNIPMKDSGIEWIGRIPEEWEILKEKYIFENLDYLREPISSESRERHNPIYDYYGASGVIDKIDHYNVEGKVLLIGEDGANLVMRNLPLIYKAVGRFWVNNHAHILKPKVGVDYDYMYYTMEAADYMPFITGAAQPKLSQENLNRVSYPVPPLSEQKSIASYLDIKTSKIDATITSLEQQREDLNSLKQSIISEAVTGKIDVRDWKPNK